MKLAAFAAVVVLLGAGPSQAQPDSYAVLQAAKAHATAPSRVERYGPTEIQRGELRLPPGRGPFPVAVVIHGGCWTAATADLSGTRPLSDALTARGWATWNIEYRRLGDPGAGWPGTFDDIAAGVDHLRRLAETQPLDLSRVVFVGHSSGAHLALWAASRARAGVQPKAVVAIDGPGGLAPFIGVDVQVCGAPVIVPLLGGTPQQKPDVYRAASPIDHLPLRTRQLFVLGELARLMEDYIRAARTAGDPIEVLTPKGATHFNIITPTTPEGAQVVDFIVHRSFAAP